MLKEKFIISNVSNAEYEVAIGKNYFTLVKQGNTNQHSYLFTSLINTCRRNHSKGVVFLQYPGSFKKIIEKYLKNYWNCGAAAKVKWALLNLFFKNVSNWFISHFY